MFTAFEAMIWGGGVPFMVESVLSGTMMTEGVEAKLGCSGGKERAESRKQNNRVCEREYRE